MISINLKRHGRSTVFSGSLSERKTNWLETHPALRTYMEGAMVKIVEDVARLQKTLEAKEMVLGMADSPAKTGYLKVLDHTLAKGLGLPDVYADYIIREISLGTFGMAVVGIFDGIIESKDEAVEEVKCVGPYDDPIPYYN